MLNVANWELRIGTGNIFTLATFHEFQLRSHRDMAVLVDVVRVSFETGIVVVSHGFTEVNDALRRPEVLLSAFAETILSTGGEGQ